MGFFESKFFAPKHNLEIEFVSEKMFSIHSEYFGSSDIVENALSFRESGLNIEKDSREAIIFVGANDMEEILKYVNIYNRGIFIEAIPHISGMWLFCRQDDFQNTITKAAITTTPTIIKTGIINLVSPPFISISNFPDAVSIVCFDFIYIPCLLRTA